MMNSFRVTMMIIVLYISKRQHLCHENLVKLVLMIFVLVVINLCMVSNVQAESFSNYSSLGGSVDRTPNKKVSKSCKTYTCGPISTIELSMAASPDIDIQNYDIGENSTLDQMMERGSNYRKLGPASLMNQMAGTGKKEIKITFPMIDYGFSGTFNNIGISVTQPGNGHRYSSAIHGLTNQDEGNREYKGTVTIEEYTPFFLKGSYSGPLMRYVQIPWADVRLVGRPDRFCPALSDPSTPPCLIHKLAGTGQISGQFNILSPWKNDDRINDSVDMKSSFVDPFRDDIKSKMAESGVDVGVDIDKEFAKAGFGSGNSSSGSGGSSSSSSSSTRDIYGDCNCSCNFGETATTQCKTSCSAAFAACKGERYKPPIRTVVNSNTANSLLPKLTTKLDLPQVKGAKLLEIDQNFVNKLEKGEVKTPTNLRKKFISALERKHPGNAMAPMREMMVKGFDSMPDNKSKLIMYKSMGGN